MQQPVPIIEPAMYTCVGCGVSWSQESYALYGCQYLCFNPACVWSQVAVCPDPAAHSHTSGRMMPSDHVIAVPTPPQRNEGMVSSGKLST